MAARQRPTDLRPSEWAQLTRTMDEFDRVDAIYGSGSEEDERLLAKAEAKIMRAMRRRLRL